MFDSFFSKIEDTHSYHTRQSSAKHLYVNFRGTSRGQRSCISSAIIWNCILDNFNPECAIGLFKKQSQTLFLNSKCDFLHEDFLTIIQDKMLYLIINLDYGTWLNC